MIIKFSKEVSQFIEHTFSKEGEWYWSQNYFKKVGDDLFEFVEFKENNGELKHLVEQMENPNPENEEE